MRSLDLMLRDGMEWRAMSRGFDALPTVVPPQNLMTLLRDAFPNNLS